MYYIQIGHKFQEIVIKIINVNFVESNSDYSKPSPSVDENDKLLTFVKKCLKICILKINH